MAGRQGGPRVGGSPVKRALASAVLLTVWPCIWAVRILDDLQQKHLPTNKGW